MAWKFIIKAYSKMGVPLTGVGVTVAPADGNIFIQPVNGTTSSLGVAEVTIGANPVKITLHSPEGEVSTVKTTPEGEYVDTVIFGSPAKPLAGGEIPVGGRLPGGLPGGSSGSGGSSARETEGSSTAVWVGLGLLGAVGLAWALGSDD